MDSYHLPETVKLISVRKFDVKMMYSSIAFDVPFRIICSSYQIHMKHPWIRKKLYFEPSHQRQLLLTLFPDGFSR